MVPRALRQPRAAHRGRGVALALVASFGAKAFGSYAREYRDRPADAGRLASAYRPGEIQSWAWHVGAEGARWLAYYWDRPLRVLDGEELSSTAPSSDIVFVDLEPLSRMAAGRGGEPGDRVDRRLRRLRRRHVALAARLRDHRGLTPAGRQFWQTEAGPEKQFECRGVGADAELGQVVVTIAVSVGERNRRRRRRDEALGDHLGVAGRGPWGLGGGFDGLVCV